MSSLLHIDRPLWVTREGPGWVWQCRVCPPPHCWCAQHAKTWDEAIADSHAHLRTDHTPRRPRFARAAAAVTGRRRHGR